MEGILHRLTTRVNPILKLVKIKAVSKQEEIEEANNAKQQAELLTRMKETKKRLCALQSAFEIENDFNVIEAYIYEINALELQYSNLFRLAKQQRIKGEVAVM